MSRWTIPLWWACSTAPASVATSSAARRGGADGARRRGARLGGPPRGPGGAEQLLREAPPLDELHREEGQAAAVAHVEDLHDVRMPEARHRLGLAGESRALRRPGISPGAHHLDGDRAVELLVSGPVHDAQPAGAEAAPPLVAGDLREVAARPRACRADVVRRRAGPGEDVIEQGLDPAEPLPALADVRKEFRVIRAGGLGRQARLQGVLDQFPDAKVIGHPSASSPLAPDRG